MGDEYWERYRSAVDRQVEKARLTESLEGLPSAGKPLASAGKPYREGWWLADFVRRENVPSSTYLPTSLQLRKEREELDDRLDRLADEGRVRETVSALNDRIRAWLAHPTPPEIPLTPVAPDEAVARWRSRQEAPTDTDRHPGEAPTERAATTSWWRRALGLRRSPTDGRGADTRTPRV